MDVILVNYMPISIYGVVLKIRSQEHFLMCMFRICLIFISDNSDVMKIVFGVMGLGIVLAYYATTLKIDFYIKDNA